MRYKIKNMRYKILFILFFMIVGAFLLQPRTASAFLWFGKKSQAPASQKPAAPVPTSQAAATLDRAAEDVVAAKYKLWYDCFEKKNVDLIIANRDKFFMTIPELNYIVAIEIAKAKKPAATNVSITADRGNLSLAGDLQRIMRGRFSVIAQVQAVDNKVRVALTRVRLYGVPIPARLLSDPLNKALDEYLAFLYQDSRYQGFSFSDQDGVLQFKPEFKK